MEKNLKLEVITGTLKNEASKAMDARTHALKNANEIGGAVQALSQFGKQVLGLKDTLEKELADELLYKERQKDSEADTVLTWVSRYIARIGTMALEAAKHQATQKSLAEGRADMAGKMADQMLKQAELEVAKSKARDEADAVARKAMEKEIEEIIPPPKKARRQRKKK